MFSAKKTGQIALVVAACVLSGIVHADVTQADEYMKRLKIYQTVQPVGDTPFGEQINLYTGELTFNQSDVVLEGTGPTISLVRGKQSAQTSESVQRPAAAGSWQLSIPRIETLTATGWTVGKADDPNRYARCTHFDRPHSDKLLNIEWWNGMEMMLEDGSQQSILKRAPQNTAQPAMNLNGQAVVFPAVTQQNWQVGCLPNTSNGQPGEGFLVVSPEGTKYWFDRLYYEPVETIYEYVFDVILKQHRALATMYVTRIEDRFGNYVTYQYTGDKLSSITASDGRSVSLQWRVDSPVVDTITVQPGPKQRVWRYEYSQADALQANLSAVVLPDQSRWSFGQISGSGSLSSTELSKCTTRTLPNQVNGNTFTITHPSGLVGEFTLTGIWHARSYVPSYCHYPQQMQEFEPYEDTPPLFGIGSLTRKTFSGPGLPTKTWEYRYPVAQGSTTTDPCAAMQTCPDTVWVDVVDPAGNRTRYLHSNRFDETEGKLLRTDVYQGETTLLRSETFGYAASSGGPYPAFIGGTMVGGNYNGAKDSFTPLKRRDVFQQGIVFTWQANSFDTFANPLSETRSNTLGYSRNNAFTYHHALPQWVIGQLATITCTAPISCAGLVERKIVYDDYALPGFTYAFGKLQGMRHNNPDGTLALAQDGNTNATLFGNWKRGIPQKITFADGTVKTAVVNDHGQIDSVTDENGYVTKYGYDLMGRLSLIDYPDGDDVNWTHTTRSFVQVQADEYGIAAGHWRQTVNTGNGYQITYFDARWQPILTREYDAANPVATQRFVGRSFDHAGRETFVAYPLANAPDYPYWNGLKADKEGWFADKSPQALPPPLCHPQPECQPDPHPDPDPNPDPPPPPFQGLGIHTAYDALGRVVTVKQDSEFGKLTTLSEYLDGLQTRITNPRGFKTDTLYSAYDQPTADWPIAIVHPEGANTKIYRDVFGKPLALTRHNADNTLTATRRYVYDGSQQLCKTIDPESAATVLSYDDAGNLTGSASGLKLLNPATCDAANVPMGAWVKRTYDARNRLQTLRYPDGLGDQDWSYTPDGLPLQVTAYNSANHTAPVTTAYAYNKRRMLNGQGETVSQHNWYAWGIGYGYDANGSLASQSYPAGLVVSYAPNALGQPTAVTSPGQNYATGIAYHPNGAIKQFTYGNGLVHTMEQNLRQLPETSCDYFGTCDAAAALNDNYDYDYNGNVAAISDGRTQNRGNRTMLYDGLDRLRMVLSPMFTQANYSYDALDNMTVATLAGGTAARNHAYCYDAQLRLTNVKTGNCNGASVIGLGYDARGNLANKNGQLFKYDYGNRLRDVPGKESYRYDGLGRRVQTTKAADQTVRLWQYSRGGQLMYGHSQLGQNKEARQEYIYLAGSLIATIERQWPSNAITALKFVHTDSLGSPVAYTDKNRVVIEKNEFEPYGLEINGVVKDGPNYTGHVADTATGMINMQARYYDPYVPHFNSRDPDTSDFNAYRYAAGNPYRYVDPDGRRVKSSGLCDWAGGCNAGSFVAGNGRSRADRELPSREYVSSYNPTKNTYSSSAPTSQEWFEGNAVLRLARLELLYKSANEIGREMLTRFDGATFFFNSSLTDNGRAGHADFGTQRIVILDRLFFDSGMREMIGRVIHEVAHLTSTNYFLRNTFDIGASRTLNKSIDPVSSANEQHAYQIQGSYGYEQLGINY